MILLKQWVCLMVEFVTEISAPLVNYSAIDPDNIIRSRNCNNICEKLALSII